VGNGSYNSLQVDARKHFSHGYTVQMAYTWSKTIDVGSNDNGENSTVSNPLNYLKGERGLAAFDRRNVLSVNGVWDLPVLKSKDLLSRIAGGWQVSGSMYFSSGAPFSISTGADTAALGGSRGLGSQRAMLVGNPFLDTGRSRQDLITAYFNTGAFAAPAVGAFGNSGRDIIAGPGTFTTNLALLKDFHLSSREALGKIQFRAEAYNLPNWVNLGNPAASLTAPNFGHISSAGAARVMQFALRYDF
jgi:hypothetical protein